MAKLTIITGEGSGKTHVIENEVVLGRSPDVSFTLKDLRSSRRHARVVKTNDIYYIEDLGSQNGTILNGKRLKAKQKLNDNDNIRIGTTWLLFSDNTESLSVGGSFYGYKIKQKLMEHDTGDMYLAEQLSLKRDVLLWVLSFDMLENQEEKIQQTQKIFLQQISNISKLFHRNLMMVMDFAATKDYFFCSFEEVDLKANVYNYLKSHNNLSVDQILEFARQVADGLEYVHSNHILHSNLTNKNILIHGDDHQRVIITGLGVSKFLSETTVSSMTRTTGILGVSEYIAPEQIHGHTPTSVQTDIYSYGCFLYQLITGEIPFKVDSTYALAQAHMHDPVPSIQDKRKDIPQAMQDMVYKCMEKDPALRYKNFTEILVELTKIGEEKEIQDTLNSYQGKKLLSQYLGERILKKWWYLFPFIAVLLSIIIFVLAPAFL